MPIGLRKIIQGGVFHTDMSAVENIFLMQMFLCWKCNAFRCC